MVVEAGVRRRRDVCECRDVRVGVDSSGGGGVGDASVGGTGHVEDYAGESAEKCVETLAIVVEIVGFARRRAWMRMRLLLRLGLTRWNRLVLVLLFVRERLKVIRIRFLCLCLVRDAIEAGERVPGGEVGVVTEQEEWRGVVNGRRVGRVRLGRGVVVIGR